LIGLEEFTGSIDLRLRNHDLYATNSHRTGPRHSHGVLVHQLRVDSSSRKGADGKLRVEHVSIRRDRDEFRVHNVRFARLSEGGESASTASQPPDPPDRRARKLNTSVRTTKPT
jgi:hypothetical protein